MTIRPPKPQPKPFIRKPEYTGNWRDLKRKGFMQLTTPMDRYVLDSYERDMQSISSTQYEAVKMTHGHYAIWRIPASEAPTVVI